MSTDPGRSPNWWVAPVLGLVVVVAAVAALIARDIYHQPASGAQSGTGAPPGSSSVPSSAQPGPTTVAYAQDFANYPQHSQLLDVLQGYFNAINDKQYDEWVSVVTPSLAAEQSKQKFLDGYKSTHDGSIYIYRADSAPGGGARVLLTFTSVQALGDAPQNFPHTCIHWQVVLPLAWDAKAQQFEVDAGITGSSPQKQAC